MYILDVSKSFVICYLKVCRYRQLIEFMNIYEYLRLRSFLDLCQRPLSYWNRNLIFSKTAMPIKVKFNLEPLGNKPKFVKMIQVTWSQYPYMVKT